MRSSSVVLVVLAGACAGPTPAVQPTPTPPAAAPVCISDVIEHATAQAGDGHDPEDDRGSVVLGPLESGAQPAPVDLDGDGQPERAVTFENLIGAHSRPVWLYASNEGCTRFVGAFESAYLWPGTQRHAGMLDLLVLLGSPEGEVAADGGGTMTRLVFDGMRYVPGDAVECPALERGVPRDARCPGPWGTRGAWQETQAWNDGAAPLRTDACLFPASDASEAFDGAPLGQVELADIDGDDAPDVAFGSEAFGGSGGHELEVYVTNHGCPRHVGRISVAGDPSWDPERKELRGGWTEATAGSCEPGDVAAVQVFYRLEPAGLVEARRVRCHCGEQSPDCT